MPEELEKQLASGLRASLDADGNLTLSEVATVHLEGESPIELPTLTTITMKPQTVRALHNFLRKPEVRRRTGFSSTK